MRLRFCFRDLLNRKKASAIIPTKPNAPPTPIPAAAPALSFCPPDAGSRSGSAGDGAVAPAGEAPVPNHHVSGRGLHSGTDSLYSLVQRGRSMSMDIQNTGS